MQLKQHAGDVYGSIVPRLTKDADSANRGAVNRRFWPIRWTVAAAAVIIFSALLFVAWHAGHEWQGLENQRLASEVNSLSQQLSSAELEIDSERERGDRFEKALTAQGRAADVKQQDQLRQQLLKAQAEATEYKQILERGEDPANQRNPIAALFSEPGVKMLTLQPSETAAGSVAYALIVENERLLFLGSNLPVPPVGKSFQLWVLRKENPNVVSAGILHPDDSRRIVFEFDDHAAVSDISDVEVTEEPEEGSPTPTGPKIFEAGQQYSDFQNRHISEGDLLTGSSLPSLHPDTSR